MERISHGFARLEEALIHPFNLLKHVLDFCNVELGVLLVDQHGRSVTRHAVNRVRDCGEAHIARTMHRAHHGHAAFSVAHEPLGSTPGE